MCRVSLHQSHEAADRACSLQALLDSLAAPVTVEYRCEADGCLCSDNRRFVAQDDGCNPLPAPACPCCGPLRPRPLALVVQLLRYDNRGGKVETALEIPTSGLRFAGRRYRLCSYVQHHGPTPKAGHYTAVVRLGDGGEERWVRCDDERVSDCRPMADAHDQQGAYLLLYSAEDG